MEEEVDKKAVKGEGEGKEVLRDEGGKDIGKEVGKDRVGREGTGRNGTGTLPLCLLRAGRAAKSRSRGAPPSSCTGSYTWRSQGELTL